MRPQWAKRMAEIITPKTGLLIALQHPIDKAVFHSEDVNRGPPFLLSPEMYIYLCFGSNTSYNELLEMEFERIYFAKPTKCHALGETDIMSVWRRR
jgi:hypothetical protein